MTRSSRTRAPLSLRCPNNTPCGSMVLKDDDDDFVSMMTPTRPFHPAAASCNSTNNKFGTPCCYYNSNNDDQEQQPHYNSFTPSPYYCAAVSAASAPFATPQRPVSCWRHDPYAPVHLAVVDSTFDLPEGYVRCVPLRLPVRDLPVSTATATNGSRASPLHAQQQASPLARRVRVVHRSLNTSIASTVADASSDAAEDFKAIEQAAVPAAPDGASAQEQQKQKPTTPPGPRNATASSAASGPQNEYYRNRCNASSQYSPRLSLLDTSTSSVASSMMSRGSSEPSERPSAKGRSAVRGSVYCAKVRFFAREQVFNISSELSATCPPGSVVVVQGDRGIDAGILVAVESAFTFSPGLSVLRAATQAEVVKLRAVHEASLSIKPRVDELLAETAARDRQLLQVTILDCEFQFDRNKLTIHYDSPARVVFKELALAYYREFGCRIWMNSVPRSHSRITTTN